jgi:uncharacterized protein
MDHRLKEACANFGAAVAGGVPPACQASVARRSLISPAQTCPDPPSNQEDRRSQPSLNVVPTSARIQHEYRLPPMRRRRLVRSARSERGGLGTFLLGFLLAVGGGYLLTNQVQVGSGPFGGWAWFGPNSFGLLLVPLLIGIALLCFNAKLLVGRLLTAAGVVIVLASVLETLRITFLPTSLFITLLMLGLLVVGLGLMARSLGGVGSRETGDGYEVELRESSQSGAQLPRGRAQSLPSAPAPEADTGAVKSVDEELAEMRARKAHPHSASSTN